MILVTILCIATLFPKYVHIKGSVDDTSHIFVKCFPSNISRGSISSLALSVFSPS